MIHQVRAIAELIDAAYQPSIGNLFHSRISNLLSKRVGKSSPVNNQKGAVEEIGGPCIQPLCDVQPIVFHRYDFIGGCKELLTL